MRTAVACVAAAVAERGRAAPSSGVVRMARRDLVYIELPDLVVAVERASAPRSPNGVYVAAGTDLGAWTIGARVSLESGRLAGPGTALTWESDTPVFDGAVGPAPASAEVTAHALMRRLVPGRLGPCPVCDLVADHDLWSRPRQRAALHALALRSAETPLTGTVLADLVGLGRGLTPETDDLVVGAVAAQHARRLSVVDALTAADLDVRLTRATTPLSCTWMRLAVEGRAIEPLRALLLGVPGSPAWHADLARLLAIGSSTGRSIAVGATLGMLGRSRRTDVETCDQQRGERP